MSMLGENLVARQKLPTVIYNSGAGAVGKTSVVNAAIELAAATSLKVAAMPSPTRKTYARLGISTEKAATEMSVEQQFYLQSEIHKDYFAGVETFLQTYEQEGYDFLFIDRCPLDHISYLIHNLAFKMTLEQVTKELTHALEFMNDMTKYADRTVVQYMQFPDFWHTYETESSDGFRYDSGGKNYMWDAILYSMLRKANGQLKNIEVKLQWPRTQMDPASRARHLMGLD